MAPVTCKIDNPVALSYFARGLRPLLALGPDATPHAVYAEVAKERQSGLLPSLPIMCQVFELAANAEQWSFPVAAVPDSYACARSQLFPTTVDVGPGDAG